MSTSTTTRPTPTPSPARRSLQLPSGQVFVGGIYAICVVGLVLLFTGQIAFTDVDPHKSEGPIESIVSISVVGTAALAIAVGLGMWLRRTADRARTGAIVFGVLSVLALPLFWAGAPGIFGASAAWTAGMTKGEQPFGGAARVAGIVGTFLALLNVLLTVGGVIVGAFTE